MSVAIALTAGILIVAIALPWPRPAGDFGFDRWISAGLRVVGGGFAVMAVWLVYFAVT